MPVSTNTEHPAIAEIAKFTISGICLFSLPCQHSCRFELTDGTVRHVRLNAPRILYFYENLCESKIVDTHVGKTHFSAQCRHNFSLLGCQSP